MISKRGWVLGSEGAHAALLFLSVFGAVLASPGCGGGLDPSAPGDDASGPEPDGGRDASPVADDAAVADAGTAVDAADGVDGSAADSATPDSATPDGGSSTCGGDTCGAFETCVSVNGAPACVCNPGHLGPYCDTCERGWEPDTVGACENVANCDGSNPCYGHGRNCRYSDAIEGDACDCDQGYAGDQCSTCAFGYVRAADGRCVVAEACAPDTCGSHGTCDDAGDVVCLCEVGWDGPHCEWCASGYHEDGGACVDDVPCEPETCDFHGSCADYTGVPVCDCSPGYGGADCSACTANYRMLLNGACVPRESCATDNPCLRATQCDDSTGAAVCDCGPEYAGEHCDTCAAGYHFDLGDVCVPDTSCIVGSTCSNRGSCAVGGGGPMCSCNWGYDGAHCESCDPDFVKIERTCRSCGEVRLSIDDLFGSIQQYTCAVASAGDSPVHYLGVEIFNTYSASSPGIAECHVDDGPFSSNWLELRMAGARPPYIVFDNAISALSFEYAGVDEPGTVEVYGDGVLVATIAPPLGSIGTLDLQFDPPVTTVLFDAHQSAYRLGLDELVYLPAICAGP